MTFGSLARKTTYQGNFFARPNNLAILFVGQSKGALLQRFQLIEGFRKKLKKEKPKDGETTMQFLARIEDYLKRWINLAKFENSFEGVCNLFLREQLLDTSSKDLEIFFKEHSCKTAEELTRLSDRYLEDNEQIKMKM